MKHLLKVLFFSLYLSVCVQSQAFAESRNLPDFLEEEELIGWRDEYQKFIADIDYFDKKYPDDSLREDFSDEVIERHPEYHPESSVSRANFLRNVIVLRRMYERIKKQVREFLLENDIPYVIDEKDFEAGDDEVYQKTEGDKALIIKDFKKVIAYSQNPRDKKIVQSQKETETMRENKRKMKEALLKKDWKTLLSYGLYDGEKPFEDMRGISELVGEETMPMSRFISTRKLVNDQDDFYGAVQIFIPMNGFVVAYGNKELDALKINLKTENLGETKLIYPLPKRMPHYTTGKRIAGYNNLLTIPVSAKIQDVKKPVSISASIKGAFCAKEQCLPFEHLTELKIDAGTTQEVETLAASFLRLRKPNLPQEERDDIKITAFETEKTEHGQNLYLAFESDKSPDFVEAFIENERAKDFDTPLIRIDGKHGVVRFPMLDSKADYVGQKFDILLATSPRVVLRESRVLEKPSFFRHEAGHMSLTIIWFAYLGGLILNLMPCVFPVLSLKILSFTQFGQAKYEQIRQDFIYHILGIVCSFAVLIIALVALKLLGYAIGWGMQFQSIWFISFMSFVILLFLAQVRGLINLQLPEFIQKMSQDRGKSAKATQFFSGMFLVLLSTPCTAPYLGTALGFAFAGSVADIVIVFSFVALGLATPYILVAIEPDFAYYVPKPGKWLRWFHRLVVLMLVLTLVWLLSLLVAQSGSHLWWHYAGFMSAIWVILRFRRASMEELSKQEKDPQIYMKLRRIINWISIALLMALIGWGMYDAASAVAKKQLEQAQVRVSQINRNTIDYHLRDGRIVLLKVGADWCLTCHYNDAMVLNTPNAEEMFEEYNVSLIEVDWSQYDAEVLAFMEKYGRFGLPFYILFAPKIPDGIVLPEVLNQYDFEDILRNLRH